MKKAVVVTVLLLSMSALLLEAADAMPNVHLDYTKTTISLCETVTFTAQASYPANVIWYLNDIKVKSEFTEISTYTFIPKALGVFFVKLSVDGFTNPPPIGAIKVTVTESVIPPPEQPPFKFVTPWFWESPPNLTVESPINGTYTGKVLLNFTIKASNNWFNNQSEKWNSFNLYNTALEQKLKLITYVLDGNVTIISADSNLRYPYKGSIELANLTQGTHQLIIYTNATGVYRSFRGYFVQTQINDTNKTVIDFNFIPLSTSSPVTEPADSSTEASFPPKEILPIAMTVSSLALIIIYYKRYQKQLS